MHPKYGGSGNVVDRSGYDVMLVRSMWRREEWHIRCHMLVSYITKCADYNVNVSLTWHIIIIISFCWIGDCKHKKDETDISQVIYYRFWSDISNSRLPTTSRNLAVPSSRISSSMSPEAEGEAWGEAGGEAEGEAGDGWAVQAISQRVARAFNDRKLEQLKDELKSEWSSEK